MNKKNLKLLFEYYDREINEIETLNEGILKTIISPFYNAYMFLWNGVKSTLMLILKGTRLDKVGNHLLNIVKDLTIMRKVLPNKDRDERQLSALLSRQIIGDTVTDISRLINSCSGILWKGITLGGKGYFGESLSNFWKGVISSNDHITFIQELYAMAVNSGVPPRYAKAYLIILAFRRPLYVFWYDWKTFDIPYLFSKTDRHKDGDQVEGQTDDDKAHAFTSGVAERDSEGLTKSDRILQEKMRKIIFIAQNESYTDIQKQSKISWRIAWESIISIIGVIFISGFRFFRLAFGLQYGDNTTLDTIDTFLKNFILIYYSYFLITALMINNIAFKQEELVNPNEDTDTSNDEEEGMKLNNEIRHYSPILEQYTQFHIRYRNQCSNNNIINIIDKARAWQDYKFERLLS